MGTDFDPYYKWLGISPVEQPPNHYRLLGVQIFESNTEVISNAADQRTTFLRTFQTGKHVQDCQRLLNEVAAARICLLNQKSKADYDQQLQQSVSLNNEAIAQAVLPLESSPLPVVAPINIQVSGKRLKRATPLPQAKASTPSISVGASVDGAAASQSSATANHRRPLMIGIAVAVGLALSLVLVVAMVTRRDRADKSSVDVATTDATSDAETPESEAKKSASTTSSASEADSPKTKIESADAKTDATTPPAKKNSNNDPIASENSQETNGSKSSLGTLVNAAVLRFRAGEYAKFAQRVDANSESTLETWIRIELMEGSMLAIGNLSPLDNGEKPTGWALQFVRDSQLRAKLLYAEPSGKLAEVEADSFPHNNLFHHLAIHSAPKVWRLYVDGILAIEHSFAEKPFAESTFPLFLGDRDLVPESKINSLAFYSFRMVQGWPYRNGVSPSMPFGSISNPTEFLAGFHRPTWPALLNYANAQSRPNAELVGGTWMNGKTGKLIDPEPVALANVNSTAVDSSSNLPSPTASASAVPMSNSPVATSPTPADPAPSTTPSDPTPAPAPSTEPAETVAKKAEPPDSESKTAIRKQVRELFKKEFASAKSPVEKMALASQLVNTARDSRDDLKSRYVLLDEAISLSTEAADQPGAFTTIETLGEDFDVDVWKLKLAVATKIGEAAKLPADRKKNVESLLSFTDDAVEHARFDIAAESVQAASTILSRISDVELRKRITQRKKELDELKKQADLAELARERLKTDPENPKANLALGKFLSFSKGEWDEGMPFLAKSDDEVLKEAAKKELAKSTEAADLEDLANRWSAAASNAGVEKLVMLERARELYSMALRDLMALAKLRVEKRVAELEKQIQSIAGTSAPRVTRKTAPPASVKRPPPSNSKLSRPQTFEERAPLLSQVADDAQVRASLSQSRINVSTRDGRAYGVSISSSAVNRDEMKEVIGTLKGLPNLVELSFTNKTFTNGTVKAISTAVPNLRRLRLSSCQLPSDEVKSLSLLSNLTELVIFGSSVSSDSIVRNLGTFNQLRELRLTGMNVSDGDFEILGRLRSLVQLDIQTGSYTGAEFRHLGNLTNLESLSLHRNYDPSALKHLQNLTNLQWVITPTQMRDTEFAYLKRLTNLQRLDLSRTQVTDSGLSQLRNYASLVNLAMPPSCTDNGMRYVESLTNLTLLNLSDTKVTDRGLRSLKNLTRLDWLQLPEATNNCEEVAKLPSVSVLHVYPRTVANGGLAALEGYSSLRTLRIVGAEQVKDGLKHVKKIPNLFSLDFDRAIVGDDSLKHLGAVLSLRSIQFMNGSSLTDTGLGYLQSCSNLGSINAYSTQVTSAGATKLKQALPNCHVLYSNQNFNNP